MQKKLSTKKQQNMEFLTFYYCLQNFSAYIFFPNFLHIFNEFELSIKFCIVW